MDLIDRLRELGRNLYWTWHPEIVEIFRDLDPPIWRESNHNPALFLSMLPQNLMRVRAADLALEARTAYAFHALQAYMNDSHTWAARHAGVLRARPVAYFSAEFGLHESLPTYAGGLGVLAGDHLKAASDLGLPLVAVGLFYAKGYFNQTIDAGGWQREHYFASDVTMLPLEQASDQRGERLIIPLATGSSEIRVAVWTARVGRCRLVLLDSNVEGNNPDDRALTSQLYGGNVRVRARQELILGVGGLRALEALNLSPGVIHLNEGHSAFAALDMCRMLMQREGRTFADVKDRVSALTVFTTHTPVDAAHDRFDNSLIEETLGPLRRQLGVSHRDLMALGRVDADSRNEEFCMTVLGLRMSNHRNGVSALHGRVSRRMWRCLWPQRPESEVPIGHITNGVHSATWLAVTVSQMYRRVLGDDWQQRMDDHGMWSAVDRIDDMEFWEQHQLLKAHLVEYVRRCLRKAAEARGEADPVAGPRACLEPSVLTIGFARRFAAYKRGDLLLRDMDRLARLVNDPARPVQIIYAGKAHPADDGGKRLIQSVFNAARDPRLTGRVVFLEDHDINVARHLVQGVDLWLNNPYRPFEACGTSGMKTVLNGGLNLSVLDGWWAEAYDGSNGFAIGRGDEHSDWQQQDRADVGSLYEVLEREVVPLFYNLDESGIPRQWVARQKNAIRTLAWRFSAARMIRDYTVHCYLPAAGGLPCSCPAVVQAR
ncbi:MAG: alpha-glucan family phosphorylase [Planctomycetaceae bacterium]|nr:alpha-glucan family phosphorylase [Planctomycetaceae bacterium]